MEEEEEKKEVDGVREQKKAGVVYLFFFLHEFPLPVWMTGGGSTATQTAVV